MSNKQPGLFMTEIDWSDPKLAPWSLSNLQMNDAQLDALLEPDEVDSPELTEEQQKELCLKVPCRVELFHANVCYGVEKGWPKRMFNKPNFEMLEPKEKRCIYRDMVRKAVFLYGEYVDEERLARRLHRTKSRTLAPYYELIFRKNQFMRLKALEQPEPGYDALISEMVAESNGDNDESVLSQQTVINTANSGTQKSNKTNERSIDLNDNECVPIGSECNVSSCDADDGDAGTAAVSVNVVSSSQDAQSGNVDIDSIPEMNSQSFVIGTPLITRRRNSAFYNDDDEEDEAVGAVDSLDFLSQGMSARTSTQQSQHMQQ